MSAYNQSIEVARISAVQAIAVALIAAVTGAGTTYMTVNSDTDQLLALEGKVSSLGSALSEKNADLEMLEDSYQASRQDLENVKQRLRDILGPKRDELTSMSLYLQKIKNDASISQHHSDRLDEIVHRLDKIDAKVNEIIQ